MKSASPARCFGCLAPSEPSGLLDPALESEATWVQRGCKFPLLARCSVGLPPSLLVFILPPRSLRPGLVTLSSLDCQALSSPPAPPLSGGGQKRPDHASALFSPPAPASAEDSWVGSFLCPPPCRREERQGLVASLQGSLGQMGMSKPNCFSCSEQE